MVLDIIRQIAERTERAANSAVEEVRRNVVPNIFNAQNTINNLFNSIPSQISNSIGSIRNTVQSVVSPIQGAIANQIGNVAQSLGGQISHITQQIGNQTGQIFGGIQSVQNTILSNLNSVVGREVGRIASLTSGIQSAVISNVKDTINFTNSLIDNTRTAIAAKVNDIKGDIAGQTVRLVGEIHKQAETFVNVAKSVENSVTSAIKREIDSVQTDILSTTGRITGAIGQSVVDIRGSIQGIENGIVNRVTQQIGNIGNTIAQIDDTIIANIQNSLRPITNLINTLPELGETIAETAIDMGLDYLGDNFREVIKGFNKFTEINPGIVKELMNGDIKSYDELKRKIDTAGLSASVAGGILMILMYASAVVSAISGFGQPVAEQATNWSRKHVKPNQWPLPTILETFHKGGYTHQQAIMLIEDLGYTNDKAQQILKNSELLLTPNEYGFMRQLGIINNNEFRHFIKEVGYDETHSDKLSKLFEFRPSVQDLISMAVKEVFTPATAELFGQYEDFPPQFKVEAQKIGIPEEWAKAYWAAHWNLPSPQMGFEMYQRDIIDLDELKILLKSLDIMPFWREKLIELNFNPLTRVDIRRMFGLGVINEEEVFNAYRATGYSPENAKLLTEFTIKYELGDGTTVKEREKELTRAVIEKAYRFGVFTRDEAIRELKDIGYQANDALILMNLVDKTKQIDDSADRLDRQKNKTISTILNGYKARTFGYEESIKELIELGFTRQESEKELAGVDNEYEIQIKQYIADAAKDLYVQRTIDKNSAISMLMRGGFTANEASRYITELDTLREIRTKKPTLAQLQKLLKRDVITLEEFREEVLGLGYHDKYIVWFVNETLDFTEE